MEEFDSPFGLSSLAPENLGNQPSSELLLMNRKVASHKLELHLIFLEVIPGPQPLNSSLSDFRVELRICFSSKFPAAAAGVLPFEDHH